MKGDNYRKLDQFNQVLPKYLLYYAHYGEPTKGSFGTSCVETTDDHA